MDDVAVGVGEDLDLDVPGPGDVALDEAGRVAEAGGGLAPGAVEGLRKPAGSTTRRMPLPPPPARALMRTG